jgi:hypothetical protein
MNNDWFMAGDAGRRAYKVRLVSSINFWASFYNLGGSELQGGESDREEESHAPRACREHRSIQTA